MNRAWTSFREGLSRSLRYWQVLAIFYFASQLGALPLVVLPALDLFRSANRPSIQEAADGIDAWMVVETLALRTRNLTQPAESVSPVPELAGGLTGIFFISLITAVVGPFLAWLTTAFLSGGAVLVYTETPQPFRWRRFWWGCWHWFGVFLLLGFVQILVAAVLLLPLGILSLVIFSSGGWPGWIILPGVGLAAFLGLVLFECTRIFAVAGGTRNLWQAFRAAFRFLLRRPAGLGGLYLLGLALLVLIHAVFRLGLLRALPLEVWPLAVLGQQSFILLRLWARSARLAGGAVWYAQGSQ
jgi:hypothetical protein